MNINVQSLEVGHLEKSLFSVDSMEYCPGEIYPLIGNNGSGKSSYLKVLAGLRPPLGGEVFYDGVSTVNLSLLELAHKRAILTTERPNFSWVSVRHILEWTCDAFFLEQEKKEKVLSEFVEYFSLQKLQDQQFYSLSDGQKQRVMLARVLCQQSPILLLDEPTSFLDVHAKEEVLSMIEAWAKDWRKTIILCTHEWPWLVRQNYAVDYIDIAKKQLVRTSPGELIDRGLYPKV